MSICVFELSGGFVSVFFAGEGAGAGGATLGLGAAFDDEGRGIAPFREGSGIGARARGVPSAPVGANGVAGVAFGAIEGFAAGGAMLGDALGGIEGEGFAGAMLGEAFGAMLGEGVGLAGGIIDGRFDGGGSDGVLGRSFGGGNVGLGVMSVRSSSRSISDSRSGGSPAVGDVVMSVGGSESGDGTREDDGPERPADGAADGIAIPISVREIGGGVSICGRGVGPRRG